MRTYADKLKDPRWQKLRLQVMNRDGFTCRICKSSTDTLNVHHLYYKPRTEPWEAPIQSLMCLCEKCHKTIIPVLQKSLALLAISAIEVMGENAEWLIAELDGMLDTQAGESENMKERERRVMRWIDFMVLPNSDEVMESVVKMSKGIASDK